MTAGPCEVHSARRSALFGVFWVMLQSSLIGAQLVGAQDAANVNLGEPPEPPPIPDASGQVQVAAVQTPPQPARPSFLDTTDRRVKEVRPPPTQNELTALRELEAEAGRFTKTANAYRSTLDELLRRDYLRKRYAQDSNFTRQIKIEEELEDKSRLTAIEKFERFIAKYPNDPDHTPDAMFRLGELYFERDSIAQQNELSAFVEARDKKLAEGGSPEGLIEPSKNFSSTIELYRTLVQRFPHYSRVDGVYYLIGYCLNEMNQANEARLAWLNLVCANEYHYTGEALQTAAAEDAQDNAQAERAQKHPALTTNPKAAAPQEPSGDVYAACEPAVPDSKFWAETWLRVGEYHFDYDYSQNGLDRAISAYNKVLARPEDRNYNLALYKVAWAYYRASRYPEAMEHFWKLVQWSDDERVRTGKGSELRAEAIQYLGIGFAYDDWNENQVPDPLEGQPSGIDRVQDPKLMPQDRPWTSEVYQRLGYVYFDEAKYADAVQIWEIALKRWPRDAQAPEIQNMIARAYTRNNEGDAALAAHAKLGDYAQGSAWWEANNDHPAEQQRAAELAEDALIIAAKNHHRRAFDLRRSCAQAQDVVRCEQAQAEYELAAKAYRGYLQRYPNNPQAYELRHDLADALYWSQNYEEAAVEYAAVRDSNLDDTFLADSARMVVEAARSVVDQQVKAGAFSERTEPPAPAGSPAQVTPVELPAPLQRLAAARETYLARVDEEHDTEHLRDSYFYNNSLLLYLYGYWDYAHDRFLITYDTHCKGPKADETGQVAWFNLRNMAVALGRSEEVRQLGKDLEDRQCTFSTEATAMAAVDCTKPENKDKPRCLAGSDITNLRYRDAVDTFARAEKQSGDEQRRLYERAASDLVKAVNEEPEHPQAPLALEKAAIALERTGRFESAARLYQRIVDEVGPRRAQKTEEQAQLDAIMANALFRLGYNANRFFDYDRAVESYRVLADSARFAKSTSPVVAESREGAIINAAKILEYRQQYEQAAQYYKRAADVVRDPAEKRAAAFRVAEMAYKQKQWTRAQTEMRNFIAKYKSDPGAAEQVVEAYARIADAAVQQKQKNTAALGDVVDAFGRSKLPAGSYAAEYAAKSSFTLADASAADFDKFEIKPGKPATLAVYVNSLKSQIEAGAKKAKTKAEAYNVVPPYRRPTWTIAAFVRQGRIYETLARGVLNAPFVVPNDLKAKMRGLPEDQQDSVKVQVEDTIRQLLDQEVRPIECLAVARYALASRAGRAGNIDDQYTREATDRINAYGDERIAECVAQAAASDPSFAAYQPGEFSRAPRGITLDLAPGVAPPAVQGAK